MIPAFIQGRNFKLATDITLLPGSMLKVGTDDDFKIRNLFMCMQAGFESASYCFLEFERHTQITRAARPTSPEWKKHQRLMHIMANNFVEQIAMIFTYIWDPQHDKDTLILSARNKYQPDRVKYKSIRDSHAHRDERAAGKDRQGQISGPVHISSLFNDDELLYSTSSGSVSVSITRDTLTTVAAMMYEIADGYNWLGPKTVIEV